MARIYSWSGKKGTCWFLDYAVNGRRVRKRIGRSKRLAELALADITVKLERREIGFAESDKKLGELITEYLRHSQAHATPQSHQLNEAVLAKFRAFIQDDKLKNIGNFVIEKYKNRRREEGVSPATVNRELAVIKAMFNRGVEWGFLIKSPAQAVKKFKEPKREARFFSAEEMARILAAAEGELKLIIMVLANTGLRREELLHLTWDDVDFNLKSLIVQAKAGWRPKDYEVRRVPLNDDALRVLREIRVRSDGGKGWVFPGRRDAFAPDCLTHEFKKLVNGLKIEGHLHTLRHTFASHLVMHGADLYAVAKLLGHANTKTTEIYAHLAPDYLHSAVGKLSFKGASKLVSEPNAH